MALSDSRQTPIAEQLFKFSGNANAQGAVLPPVARTRKDLEKVLSQLYPAHKPPNKRSSVTDEPDPTGSRSTSTLPSTSLHISMSLFQKQTAASRHAAQPDKNGLLELKRVEPIQLFGNDRVPQRKRARIAIKVSRGKAVLQDVSRREESVESHTPILEEKQQREQSITTTTTKSTTVNMDDILQEVLSEELTLSRPSAPSLTIMPSQPPQQKSTPPSTHTFRTPDQSPFQTPAQSPVISTATIPPSAAAAEAPAPAMLAPQRKEILPRNCVPAIPTDLQKERCDIKMKMARYRGKDSVSKKNYFEQTIDLLNHPLMDECRLLTQDQALESGKTRLLKALIDYWQQKQELIRLAVIVYDMNMEQFLFEYMKRERKVPAVRFSDALDNQWQQERGIIVQTSQTVGNAPMANALWVDIMLVLDLRVRPSHSVFNKLISNRPPLYMCTLGTVEQRAAQFYQDDTQNAYTWSNLWWSADSRYQRLITEENDWQECAKADSIFETTIKSIVDWYSKPAGTAYQYPGFTEAQPEPRPAPSLPQRETPEDPENQTPTATIEQRQVSMAPAVMTPPQPQQLVTVHKPSVPEPPATETPEPVPSSTAPVVVSDREPTIAAAAAAAVETSLDPLFEGTTPGSELSDRLAERIKKLFAFRPATFELAAPYSSAAHTPLVDSSDGESYYSATDHDLGDEACSVMSTTGGSTDDEIAAALKTYKEAYDKECEMILQRLQKQYEQEVELARKSFALQALRRIRNLEEHTRNNSSL